MIERPPPASPCGQCLGGVIRNVQGQDVTARESAPALVTVANATAARPFYLACVALKLPVRPLTVHSLAFPSIRVAISAVCIKRCCSFPHSALHTLGTRAPPTMQHCLASTRAALLRSDVKPFAGGRLGRDLAGSLWCSNMGRGGGVLIALLPCLQAPAWRPGGASGPLCWRSR